jgi:hypothetical protein
MKDQIRVSKDILKSDEDLVLNITYEHPDLNISINTDVYYSYFYEGTIEDILKSNKISTHVIAEYFMNGLKKINSATVNESAAIFSFPLQINYVKHVIKIVCNVKTHTDQNYIIKKVSEKLTSKIVELDEKCRSLEMEVSELKKYNHVEMTINFPDAPISFNEYVTSINLYGSSFVDQNRVIYKNEITLPRNLKQLNISNLDWFKENKNELDLPKSLENLKLVNIYDVFNKPINFNSMTNLTELILTNLGQFNHPIEIEKLKNLRFLKLYGLGQLTHPINIPKGVETIELQSLTKCENITIPKSTITIVIPGGMANVLVKCFSERDDINTKLIQEFTKLQFPKSREWFVSSFISNSKIPNRQISYF